MHWKEDTEERVWHDSPEWQSPVLAKYPGEVRTIEADDLILIEGPINPLTGKSRGDHIRGPHVGYVKAKVTSGISGKSRTREVDSTSLIERIICADVFHSGDFVPCEIVIDNAVLVRSDIGSEGVVERFHYGGPHSGYRICLLSKWDKIPGELSARDWIVFDYEIRGKHDIQEISDLFRKGEWDK